MVWKGLSESNADKMWTKSLPWKESGAMPLTRERLITNLVIMGMGEPMANDENLLRLQIKRRRGAGIGARKITISTSGLVPRIREWRTSPNSID